jgi:Lrp/AsnC family leucine-responsive transcriptional regulator
MEAGASRVTSTKGRNGQVAAGSCFVRAATCRSFRPEAGRCNLQLDDIDVRILEELQRDSSRTNVLLARTVGLSPPACLRRVRRLRAGGAIHREMAVIDPKIAGLHMSVLAGVVLERESRELIAAFKRRVIEDEAVAQCWYVTGQYDFLVLVHVRDVAAYEALGERLFHSDPNVRRYESLVVLDEVKRDFAVPLRGLRRAG